MLGAKLHFHSSSRKVCDKGKNCYSEQCRKTRNHAPENALCSSGQGCWNFSCHFVHPVNRLVCVEGSQCLDEVCRSQKNHPSTQLIQCKNGDSCPNPNCTFAHPTQKRKALSTSTKGSLTECIFGINCTNTNCSFGHPPCKFANNCTKPKCQFSHPTQTTQPNNIVYCRFAPNCTKPQCPFIHPESKSTQPTQSSQPIINSICRFSPNCTNLTALILTRNQKQHNQLNQTTIHFVDLVLIALKLIALTFTLNRNQHNQRNQSSTHSVDLVLIARNLTALILTSKPNLLHLNQTRLVALVLIVPTHNALLFTLNRAPFNLSTVNMAQTAQIHSALTFIQKKNVDLEISVVNPIAHLFIRALALYALMELIVRMKIVYQTTLNLPYLWAQPL